MLTRNRKRTLETDDDQSEQCEKRMKLRIKKVEQDDQSFALESLEEEESSDTHSSDEEEVEEEENDDEFDEKVFLEKLKKSDKKLYDSFMNVRGEIEKRTPNVNDILRANIRLKDKAKLIELYDIYKNLDPCTEERHNLKNNITKLFKQYQQEYSDYSKFSESDLEKMKSESSRLKEVNTDTNMKHKILSLNASLHNKAVIYRRYKELKSISIDNEEYHKNKHWLKWAIAIPHDTISMPTSIDSTNITTILNNVARKLDEQLYGMKKVKEQILLFLNSKLRFSGMRGCSLGLVGDSGTGKTSIVRAIADALNYPFEQVSFGGVSNPEFLTGHDFTYIGSNPGEIVRCLSRMKCKNGILFFDEFEKVSKSPEIISTLLHITDFSQNNQFRDNFLSELTIDLSHIWFVYSMNQLPTDTALKDRLFVINVSGYNHQEKDIIVREYLCPKLLKNIGRAKGDIIISEDVSRYIIDRTSSDEKGIRTLEKTLKDILNKIHFLVCNKDEEGKIRINFQFSFDIKGVLKYPIILTKSMVDIFLTSERLDESFMHMYI